MNFKALGLAAFAATAFAGSALAHHSFAMFDAQKTVALTGTVTELQWTNPHSWLRVAVQDQAGTSRQWAFEMGGPAQSSRAGWKPDSVRPGDKVTVTMHPLRDGSRGGQFLSAVLPNGQEIGNGGRRPNPLGDD